MAGSVVSVAIGDSAILLAAAPGLSLVDVQWGWKILTPVEKNSAQDILKQSGLGFAQQIWQEALLHPLDEHWLKKRTCHKLLKWRVLSKSLSNSCARDPEGNHVQPGSKIARSLKVKYELVCVSVLS